MSASGSSAAAAALLARIPVSARRAAVSDAIGALSHAGPQDLTVVSALLRIEDEEELLVKAADGLLALLQKQQLDSVVAVCHSNDRLAHLLLQAVTDQLTHETYKTYKRPAEDSLDQTTQLSADCLAMYMAFARSMLFLGLAPPGLTVPLLLAALNLLRTGDSSLLNEAKDLAFQIVSSGVGEAEDKVAGDVRTALWTAVKWLARADDSTLRTVGHGLWLRSTKRLSYLDLSTLHDPEYWDLLAKGLQLGDAEQRKCCLAILRISVTMAVKKPSLLPMISNGGNISDHHYVKFAAEAIEQQYARFCTVFETIVLSRYLNQVMECEHDLDILAAPGSNIPNIWLYTLLSAAMDPRFQDSNRRFIALWIFKGKLQPSGAMVEYTRLLRQHLLPWATEGRLFTMSLRRINGVSTCAHGQTLAEYIFTLLSGSSNSTEDSEALLVMLLGLLTQKSKSLFAYAGVYVLEGIDRAFRQCPSMVPGRQSLELALELSAWSGLPEIADCYFKQRCHAFCQRADSSEPAAFTQLSAQANLRWKSLRIALGRPVGEVENIPVPAISQRLLNERNSIDKCDKLIASLQSDDTPGIESKILDLWSDVEYLEYPKGLLGVMLRTLLRPEMIQAAIVDQQGIIARVLENSSRRFHKLAESRLYLLSELIAGVRAAVLTDERAASILPVEEMILRIACHPPEPTLDFQLEDSTIQLLQDDPTVEGELTYEAFFGKREGFGFAAVIDLVSRLHHVSTMTTESLLGQVMAPWLAQKAPIPIVSKWKTPLQVQVMLLCTEQQLAGASQLQAGSLLHDLHRVLAIEPLPRYRFLFEWVIARIYVRLAELRNGILDQLATNDHHSNPKYLASLMKVAVMLALSSEASEKFARQLANALVGLSASSKVIIRHEAQWSFPQLWDHAETKGWTSITSNNALAALNDYVRSLERYTDPPGDRELGKLDPVEGNTLVNLAEGLYLDIEPPIAPLARYDDFTALEVDDRSRKLNLQSQQRCMPFGDRVRPPVTKPERGFPRPRVVDDAATAIPTETPAKSLALQTKGTAYLSDSPSTRPKHELLVVASLIDNPYNLGGLSRASEIFGASSLHLANPRVTSNKDFTAVSVSSHLHIPLQALSVAELPSFLAQKKVEGYTVVGIEQTDRSVVLGSEDARLPSEKVILVLGSEKEGIPAVVLGGCDVLVEIPQQGITRSLNVQTAAAIVLFELTRQRDSRAAVK